jgi:hypothetical protein
MWASSSGKMTVSTSLPVLSAPVAGFTQLCMSSGVSEVELALVVLAAVELALVVLAAVELALVVSAAVAQTSMAAVALVALAQAPHELGILQDVFRSLVKANSSIQNCCVEKSLPDAGVQKHHRFVIAAFGTAFRFVRCESA